jgi:hypothetical protein
MAATSLAALAQQSEGVAPPDPRYDRSLRGSVLVGSRAARGRRAVGAPTCLPRTSSHFATAAATAADAPYFRKSARLHEYTRLVSRSETITRPKESSAMPVGRFHPSALNERMSVPEAS